MIIPFMFDFRVLIIYVFTEPLLEDLPLDGEFAWPTICFNIIWEEMHSTRYILYLLLYSSCLSVMRGKGCLLG